MANALSFAPYVRCTLAEKPAVTLLWSVAGAFLLDWLFAEPKKLHPLVAFGTFASAIEQRFNTADSHRWQGLAALLIALLPILLLVWWLDRWLTNFSSVYWVFAGFMLYLTLGWQSLLRHAGAVSKPLQLRRLDEARAAVAMLVSRDTADLDASQIAKAATESVLENGADAIFSALFWFLIAGVPGVVAYRLTNTLDAMWGYKNARFVKFGWAAARLDDVLNFVPARLTALSYALMGDVQGALKCWRQQASEWKSPNAGPVMAAGAGALHVALGGTARYHGQLEYRPALGPEMNATSHSTQPSAATITQACSLVNRAIGLWLLVLMVWVVLL